MYEGELSHELLNPDDTVIVLDVDGTLIEPVETTGFDGMEKAFHVLQTMIGKKRGYGYSFEQEPPSMEQFQVAWEDALVESAGTTDYNLIRLLLDNIPVNIRRDRASVRYFVNIFNWLRHNYAVNMGDATKDKSYQPMAGNPYSDAASLLGIIEQAQKGDVNTFVGLCTGNPDWIGFWKLPFFMQDFVESLSPDGERMLLLHGNHPCFDQGFPPTKAGLIEYYCKPWISDGTYYGPQIVLIDDSLRAFEGLPSDVGRVLIDRSDNYEEGSALGQNGCRVNSLTSPAVLELLGLGMYSKRDPEI